MRDARFFFTASGMRENAFSVFSFSGDDAMDTGYRFEILLLSKEDEAEKNLINAKLRFGVRRLDAKQGDAVWNGIAESAAYVGGMGDWHCYRVVLVPRAAALRHAVASRIFMNLALPDLIETVLKQEGWTAGTDFALRVTEKYDEKRFVCRYNESAFAFMSRHMERLGLYSFIRQDDGGDCLVLVDSMTGHGPLPEGGDLVFEAPSGLVSPEAARPEEVVFAFSRVLSRRPGSVRLLEYERDDATVSLDVESEPAPPEMPLWGGVTLFGEGYDTQEEGRRLADMRSQSLRCRTETFEGKSHISYLRPGYTFALTRPRRFRGRYLLVSAHHEGSRAKELGASLGFAAESGTKPDGYANSFTCIPAATQYRAAIQTPRPTIHGVVSVVIDTAGDKTPILDNQGCYTVRFPFDRQQRGPGNSSIPLRMMQAHAGAQSGIHFPLQNGVEALIAFVGGNPDRPVLVGALPNKKAPSPVTANNQTMSVIRTPGGHRIEIDDAQNKGALRIVSPEGSSFIGMLAVPKKEG